MARFFALAKKLGLDKKIYTKEEQWRRDVIAMIVGRIIYQGSKLSLTNMYNDSALWELYFENWYGDPTSLELEPHIH